MSTPEPPGEAAGVFGVTLPLAERYAELLCGPGVERGLLGPAEPDRIWGRHLLNCAAAAGHFPQGADCLDLGSGAGLPGVVLALLRPDLSWLLVDATRRRTDFLAEVVRELALADRVEVRWARAEELAGAVSADVVVARAVAPLPRLWGWAEPLLRPGGFLLAMKGERAESEVAEFRQAHTRPDRVALFSEQAAGEPVRLVRIDVPAGSAGGAGPAGLSPTGRVSRTPGAAVGRANRRTSADRRSSGTAVPAGTRRQPARRKPVGSGSTVESSAPQGFDQSSESGDMGDPG